MILKNNFRYILLFFISSRLFFVLATIIAVSFIPLRLGYLGDKLNPNEPFLFWVWANFDGQHYLSIAIEGYKNSNFAFFPLYPALISIIHDVTKLPHLYAGILISLTSFFLAIWMIYKITRIDFKSNIAWLTIIFLSFFPLSFYYHSVYTDSLFLLLTTSSFYFARKGKWYLCGLFGALATADRLSGLSLIPALALEWYLQNSQMIKSGLELIISFIRKALLPLSLILLGFLSYALYLQIKFEDWLLFQKSMIAWQQDEFVFPLRVLYRYIKIFFSVHPGLVEYWIAVLEFISFLCYISLSIYVWKKIRPSYGLFMVILLMLVTFTGTLWGSPRYFLHLFPGFIGLALLAHQNNLLKMALILVFLVLGSILTALFTRGYFVS